MAADPVSRLSQLQMRDIAFDAQIPHLEELKQNDTSFNRTAVTEGNKVSEGEPGALRDGGFLFNVRPWIGWAG